MGVRAAYQTRSYHFRYPDLYRLRVSQLWVTHRAVPSEASRRHESFADRYWFKDAYYRDLRYDDRSQYRRWYCEADRQRERRRARCDMESVLADLAPEVYRTARIRV